MALTGVQPQGVARWHGNYFKKAIGLLKIVRIYYRLIRAKLRPLGAEASRLELSVQRVQNGTLNRVTQRNPNNRVGISRRKYRIQYD
jgi:hypothetical protein